MQAPDRDTFQLLDWIMSRHVHEYLDVAGRPVGEGRAAASRHVPTEMQPCPYAGSRHRHARPMNVSALRNILPAWDDILTTLAWLSQRYRARRGKGVTTYDDLSLVTGAGVFLADFLVLRRHRPLRSGEIPLLISGLYKVCLGFQLATFLGSMRERFGGAAPARLPDSAAFYDGLEGQGLLIGEAEVCSGSAAMIIQAYDAMTRGQAVGEGALAAACGGLEVDWQRFDAFAKHTADIWSDLTLYVIRTGQSRPRLADPRLPPEVQSRLNDCLKRRAAQLLAGQRGLVVDVARAAQESCGITAAWPSERPAGSAGSLPPGGLAALVLAWLKEEAAADVQTYEPVVSAALRSQLDPFDSYEADGLAGLNEHLACLRDALGLGPPGAALTASALSQVCGRTWRDWGDTRG